MDWAHPLCLLILPPALVLVGWFHRRSLHPMPGGRRRVLLAVRSTVILILILALAGPARELKTREESVIFVADHSASQGRSGMRAAHERIRSLADALPADAQVGLVSAGASVVVHRAPSRDRDLPPPDEALLEKDGAQTDLAAAVDLARGLFPPGTARRLVLVGDGVQTRGDLEEAARRAALSDVVIDAVPVAGESRPDVRVVRLRSSRSRSHEGASLELSADLESTLSGEGRLRLFENGVEVETRPLRLEAGRPATEVFRRTPEQRNLYSYRVRAEGFAGDVIPENDEAMALVDVQGRPNLLYVEGDELEARYLADAMTQEGIRLHARPAEAIPESVQELAGFDGVILSDIPARKISDRSLAAIRDYVERLGGGFMMVGGMNSFGVGGYYRTPIEEILPVKIKPPDEEERRVTALVLVIDRSGSMSGQKIEICKSAAIATVELLGRRDYIGVTAFDSEASWVVPMTRAAAPSTINAQIATINAGGGTNIMPGMTAGLDALRGVTAKIKHMIVLTDGQSEGTGYPALSAQMKSEGMTVSTVGVGEGADTALLQSIASAGGGQFYFANEPSAVPKIFTQDAMTHMGRLIREEAFTPKQVERHPMLKGWNGDKVPQLLGYVKTARKATAQVPLVTDLGDPLLAHWRFGLGKVTAFTSDCKSRWAALWVAGWPGYGQFWAQVLREMAREPQGRHMDLRIDERGGEARMTVDVMEDAARFRNDAAVETDLYFVPATAMGSAMRPIGNRLLKQTGPGLYEGSFSPDRAGVYLVRARAGADLVSAGLVVNVSGESAGGRVDHGLLEKICGMTGGKLISPGDGRLSVSREGHARFVDLGPALLKLLLLLFMVDLTLRRWENVAGMIEWLRGRRA